MLVALKKELADENDLSSLVEDEKEQEAVEETATIIAQGLEAQLDYLINRNIPLDVIADEYDLKPNGPYNEGISRCQNCGWKGDTADTVEIVDLFTRVTPGELMPSGQCPKCGALCHLVEK